MSVGVRRSEIEIIRDILRMGAGRATTLRYTVNLSHSQMQKYLAFLERSGLIRLERQGSRALTFQTTDKGWLALDHLERVFEVMGLDCCSGTGTD
jgi:predicted transcriptional regulator